MLANEKDQLLPGVAFHQSPNAGARPPGVQVDLIVVHGISVPAGEFGGVQIKELFLNCLDCSKSPELAELEGLRVSAHLLIDRAGKVTQFVPFDRRAWHAGESIWLGRAGCNDYSVGIELEGTDQLAYTPVQYDQLVITVGWLMRRFPAISPDRVVGHCQVSPQRKSDPGLAFNWAALRRRLRS